MMAMDVGVDSDEDAKDSIAAIFEWFDSENKGYITTGQLR
jgi:Ca2+-binding EF-hand superfamily protein